LVDCTTEPAAIVRDHFACHRSLHRFLSSLPVSPHHQDQDEAARKEQGRCAGDGMEPEKTTAPGVQDNGGKQAGE
jgi:hypothetical protein